MIEQSIRFCRCHIKEEDAQYHTMLDVDAFKREFPDAIQNMKIQMLREYYADKGVVAYLVTVKVIADKETFQRMDAWLRLSLTAKQIDAMQAML